MTSAQDGVPDARRTWAVVLAAGDGRRLEGWVRETFGEAVPKQFCALHGSKSMLRLALDRAGRLVPRERLVVVVAEQHARWWRKELSGIYPGNVVVQPRNRGTGVGILLALFHVCARDPDATIVWLPSDHHLERERTLALALRRARWAAAESPEHVVLLGFRAEEPDPEYGWIVPGPRRGGTTRAVDRFHEKPDLVTAEKLLAAGALVNAFIFAARAAALLPLFERSVPQLVDAFRAIRELGDAPFAADRLHDLYEALPAVDFSKEVLQGAPDRLQVLPVASCGWTDLGTPDRIRRCLARKRIEPARIVQVA
jgi:mannose-1-phosphate guanylyltransferase